MLGQGSYSICSNSRVAYSGMSREKGVYQFASFVGVYSIHDQAVRLFAI